MFLTWKRSPEPRPKEAASAEQVRSPSLDDTFLAIIAQIAAPKGSGQRPSRPQRCYLKMLFGIIACTPRVPSTNCVISISTATLVSA